MRLHTRALKEHLTGEHLLARFPSSHDLESQKPKLRIDYGACNDFLYRLAGGGENARL